MNPGTTQKGLTLLVGLLLAGCSTLPPETGDLRLPAPESETDRAYLGLPSGQEKFLLEDIQGEVILVDCFDMYCHACQSGAGRVNELYRMVQARGLGEQIKFIGLGLNNTPLEVATFQRKFDVPFPVFPDRSRAVADQFGRARLPSMLVLCNRTSTLRLLHQHNGTLGDREKFLELILEEMKKGCPDPQTDLRPPLQDCEKGVCDPLPPRQAAG